MRFGFLQKLKAAMGGLASLFKLGCFNQFT